MTRRNFLATFASGFLALLTSCKIQTEPEQNTAYLQYVTGGPGETWPMALQRLQTLLLSLSDPALVAYAKDGTIFEQPGGVDASHLSSAEEKFGLTLPEDLKTLLIRRFAIYLVGGDVGRWGERRILDINEPDEYFAGGVEILLPLPQAIEEHFGSHFCEKSLSAEQFAELTRRYYCFGHSASSDQDSTYLLFDRDGGYGSVDYIDEDWPTTRQQFAPLLAGEKLTQSLDELMVSQINIAIARLLEYNDLPI